MTPPDDLEEPDSPAADREAYPGVLTAFDLIIPSYELAERRLQAVDSWLQNLQAFTATLTVGATVVASGVVDDISFRSWWFILAMAAFAATILVGLLGRVRGEIRLISPRRIFDDDWLGSDEWTFKKDLLYYAGDDFDHNQGVVEQKSFAAQVMTALFLIEALLLVSWVLAEQ